MSESSEVRKVYREYSEKAIAQGWRIEEIKSGWTFLPPDRTRPGVTLHKTPSDHRWLKNFRSTMRRSGFND